MPQYHIMILLFRNLKLVINRVKKIADDSRIIRYFYNLLFNFSFSENQPGTI